MLVSDLARADAAGFLTGEAEAALGLVDVLVNNAGVAQRAPTVDLDAAVVDLLYAVNVRAPPLLIAALLPGMIGRGSGSIVNLSSVSGVVGTPNRAADRGPDTPSPVGRAGGHRRRRGVPVVRRSPLRHGRAICADGGMARTLDIYGGQV